MHTYRNIHSFFEELKKGGEIMVCKLLKVLTLNGMDLHRKYIEISRLKNDYTRDSTGRIFFVFYLLKGKLEWPDAKLSCSNRQHTNFECIIQR